MKKTLLFLTMCVSLISFAQEDKKENEYETKTLFSKNEGGGNYISGWGGVTPSYQMLNGKSAYGSFARGGVLINHKYTIGLGGGVGFTASDINKELSDTMKFSTFMGYGGLFFGYDLKPAEPIHLSFSLLLGAGMITYEETNNADTEDDHADTPENHYEKELEKLDNSNKVNFVARPSVGVDFNITKWFRAGIEAGYIIAPNKEQTIESYYDYQQKTVVKKNGMSGFMAGISLKFGVF